MKSREKYRKLLPDIAKVYSYPRNLYNIAEGEQITIQGLFWILNQVFENWQEVRSEISNKSYDEALDILEQKFKD